MARSHSKLSTVLAAACGAYLVCQGTLSFIAGPRGARAPQVSVRTYSEPAEPTIFYRNDLAYSELNFANDIGYLPDGTPMNRVGNLLNHPEMIGPDPHVDGSALPKAVFFNDVGYLPDGTPMNRVGNLLNHPEMIGPDPHVDGTPLLPPLKGFVNDIGYTPDGTDMTKAGNLINHS